MAFGHGDFKPYGGFLLIPGEDAYNEPILHREAIRPRNGLPPTVPYTYNGTDFTVPAEITALTVRMRRRRTTRPGPPPIDPGGPDLPLSAPAEWIHEWEAEAGWDTR